MSYEPDPGSLDAETFKPLHFKVDGDDQWRYVIIYWLGIILINVAYLNNNDCMIRMMPEAEVLEAYRGSTIPSSTLFRRGDGGIPRTLGTLSLSLSIEWINSSIAATLLLWNGRECPFANFSEPEKREGGREKSRRHSGSGSYSQCRHEKIMNPI